MQSPAISLWQYSRRLGKDVPPSVKRTIALYGDKVYVPTSDVHVVALDAKTGRVVWDREVASRASGYGMTGGPLVAKGKVMVGTTGRAAGGNLIVALDAETGQEAWRFNAIAQPNTPFGNSWNGVPVEKRHGASVWVAGSFDPATGLALFGVAQTYDTGPYRDLVKDGDVTNDLLYTDSTVAINPDTGKLAWHYQHQPNDQWDLDWAFEQVLLKLPSSSKMLVATSGKQAIYDVVEADTGSYVFSIDLGLQDIVTSIDPKTGAKNVNPRLIPGKATPSRSVHTLAAPNHGFPSRINAETRTMFVPLVESCMDLTPVAPGGRGAYRPACAGRCVHERIATANTAACRPSTWKPEEWSGRIVSARRNRPASSPRPAASSSPARSTACSRHDDETGKELWKVRLNDVPNSAPISYMVNGKQYVAVTVGNGGAQAATFPALVPEIKNPPDRGAAIWVFELK